MFDQINEIMDMMMKDEKFIPNVAKLLKKLFDELVQQGFTEDQAALIVANYKATGQ